MDELIEWLRAQLGEDAAKARAALAIRAGLSAGPVEAATGAPSHVQVAAIERWAAPPVGDVIGEYEAPVQMPHGTIRVTLAAGAPAAHAVAEHIALHDPARVLAEVDAKRRIIDEHAPNRYGDCRICGGPDSCGCMSGVDHPCDTLRLVALPYADRPGYRDEWRP